MISYKCGILDDRVEDVVAKNTIIHELLHTVRGCHGHTGKWKILADYVNLKLTQYNIKRTTSSVEKGLEAVTKEPTYRYAVQCTKCGQIIRRQKMSKLIQYPHKCGRFSYTNYTLMLVFSVKQILR